MTQLMEHAPSDIDVDLSSDAASEGRIEAEASQLLGGAKTYDMSGARRMEFSPTPSPPLPPAQFDPASLPPSAGANGRAGSEGSAKEGSVGSSAVAPASPAATPSRSRTSIWVHFTRDPDYATNRRGRCVYCHNYYSCSSGSTGNMWRHIKRSHPEKATHAAPLATHGTLPKSDSDARPRKRPAPLASPVPAAPGPSPQLALPPSQQPAGSEPPEPEGLGHAMQLLLSLTGRSHHERTAPPRANAGAGSSLASIPEAEPDGVNRLAAAVGDALRAHTAGNDAGRSLRAYVDYMIRDLVPAAQMAAPGMQRLLSAVGSGSAVPTAAKLDAEVLRRRDAAVATLRARLDTADRVSVSLSTGRVGGERDYLAVHAHWADAGLQQHNALLEWRCVDGAATAGDIVAAFEGTLTRFALFGRLGAVTTNHTREFVDFLNQAETICHARGASFDLDRSQATCVASTLLDARATLLRHLTADDTPLTRLRAALLVLRASDRADMCRRHGASAAALDCDGSWTAVTVLLRAALAMRAELAGVLRSLGHVLVPADWLWLAQALALTAVVSSASDALAALPSFPSIVDAVPVYDALADDVRGLLAAPTLADSVRRAADALRELLAQCHPFQASPIYRLAPLFDPRLKVSYYADRGYDPAWTERVVRDARALLAEHTPPAAAVARDAPPP
ncbi:hypothetical protein H4S01_005651, partial [Coemansia sp. RSA 2610]